MDCIVHGVSKSRTQLSDFNFQSQTANIYAERHSHLSNIITQAFLFLLHHQFIILTDFSHQPKEYSYFSNCKLKTTLSQSHVTLQPLPMSFLLPVKQNSFNQLPTSLPAILLFALSLCHQPFAPTTAHQKNVLTIVTFMFYYTFHFPALEKELSSHSSVLAWRISGTEEPGGLPSMGSHRVRHD